MPLRKRKPTSAGRRFQTVSDFNEITKTRPEKSLLAPQPGTGGRNSYGRKTARHRGGGHKQQYRIIDFKRNKDGVPATVAAIEYDPNRNARIALLHFYDGEKRYILAPASVRIGDVLQNGQGAEIRPGNALPLRYIPVGALATLEDVADAHPSRGEYVALLSVDVVQQRDAGVAVGVVFDARHLGRDPVLVAPEVDDPVLLLMAAAAVARGLAAVVVAPAALRIGREQRFLGAVPGDLGEVRDRLEPPSGAGGFA